MGDTDWSGNAPLNYKHPAYVSWRAMVYRCCNENAGSYKYYGARGVTVCERWRSSFEVFLQDMGPRPSPKHSLDRFPNRNGNYEPGNCRWATALEQVINRDVSVLVEHDGKLKPINEVAVLTGVPSATLRNRLARGESGELLFRPSQARSLRQELGPSSSAKTARRQATYSEQRVRCDSRRAQSRGEGQGPVRSLRRIDPAHQPKA